MTIGTSSSIYYDPFSAEIDRNVHAVWRLMREEQPVYWNERYGFWALSRFEDVWTGYHDTATFSSTHGVQPEALDKPVGLPLVIFMDPPEHDWMRKLVSPAFTPRRIAALEARAEPFLRRGHERLDLALGADVAALPHEVAAELRLGGRQAVAPAA